MILFHSLAIIVFYQIFLLSKSALCEFHLKLFIASSIYAKKIAAFIYMLTGFLPALFISYFNKLKNLRQVPRQSENKGS
jgi:hypothetical protein